MQKSLLPRDETKGNNFRYLCPLVKFHKVIISAFLLFAYSIGFAHNVIPHCHNEGEEKTEHCEKQHKHHYHSEDGTQCNTDFLHENHYDDCLLDLLICMLDENKHPCSDETKCEYVAAQSNSITSNWLIKIQFTPVLLAEFTEWLNDEVHAVVSPDISVAYSSPPLSDSPTRGPPSLFC